jgi:GntR family transcriptional regulator
MTQPADDLTAQLRERITTGDLAPGDRLPTYAEAVDLWDVPERAIRAAYRALTTEGLIRASRGKGTIVLGGAPAPEDRRRTVYRDQLGYYFDQAAKGYRLIGTPTVTWSTASPDIARRLAIPAGSEVIVRDRTLGIPGTRADTGPRRAQPMQVSTSHYPQWLVDELPIVGEAITGPGGLYDRIEEWAQGPLSWVEAQGAVLADAEMKKRLGVPLGAALVRWVRVASLPDGRPVEAIDVRVDAARVETVMTLERDESAGWPPDPAVESPQVSDTDGESEEAP